MNNDLISREALKNHITDIYECEEKIDKKWALGLKYSLKIIDLAPAVEPEITPDDLHVCMTESHRLGYELAETKFKRPKGEWILNKDENPECPFCHHSFTYWGNFCGHCGADMRKETEK